MEVFRLVLELVGVTSIFDRTRNASFIPPSSGCSKRLMRKGTLVMIGREVLLDRMLRHHIHLTVIYNYNWKIYAFCGSDISMIFC